MCVRQRRGRGVFVRLCLLRLDQVYVCERERVRVCMAGTRIRRYGVATTSRLIKIIGLFCRILSIL